MPVDDQTSRNNWVTISGRTGKIEKLKEVLARGADIDHFDGAATALMYACERGHIAYVKEILALGADRLRKNRDGKTALDLAMKAGHREIVDYFLALGPPDPSDPDAEEFPRREIRELREALEGGPDTGALDDRLRRAAAQGKDYLVEILLGRGADPNAPTRFGHTATMLAVYHEHAATAERLFRAGGTLPESPLFLPSAEALGHAGIEELVTKYNPIAFEALWQRRVRVEAADLTIADLERYPIWESCGDEDDDTTVKRPVPFVEPFDHAVMGLVRVEFLLPGGETFTGQAHWDGFSGDSFAQAAQPELWTGTDWVDFYDTFNPPSRARMDALYEALGLGADRVVPMRVRSAVELANQPRERELDGFAWFDCGKGGSQRVLSVR